MKYRLHLIVVKLIHYELGTGMDILSIEVIEDLEFINLKTLWVLKLTLVMTEWLSKVFESQVDLLEIFEPLSVDILEFQEFSAPQWFSFITEYCQGLEFPH